jgi:hypothetical protein
MLNGCKFIDLASDHLMVLVIHLREPYLQLSVIEQNPSGNTYQLSPCVSSSTLWSKEHGLTQTIFDAILDTIDPDAIPTPITRLNPGEIYLRAGPLVVRWTDGPARGFRQSTMASPGMPRTQVFSYFQW